MSEDLVKKIEVAENEVQNIVRKGNRKYDRLRHLLMSCLDELDRIGEEEEAEEEEEED